MAAFKLDWLYEYFAVEVVGVEFLDQKVRRAGVELHCGCRGDGTAIHVGRDEGVVGFGHAGDFFGFQYPAALSHI